MGGLERDDARAAGAEPRNARRVGGDLSLTRSDFAGALRRRVRCAGAPPFVAFVSASVLCVVALSASAAAGDSAGAPFSGTATVVDGDGLEVAGKKVRLFGIDAPETSQYCKADGGYRRRCGQYATVELDRMAGGKPVVCTPKDEDRYGRVVAVCSVEGRDIGREMVRAGWAVAYVRYSNDYVSDERWARENRKGIWAEEFDGVEMPWEFRSRNHGSR